MVSWSDFPLGVLILNGDWVSGSKSNDGNPLKTGAGAVS
jgi:hypothetical protein